jgi:hypothetical protein
MKRKYSLFTILFAVALVLAAGCLVSGDSPAAPAATPVPAETAVTATPTPVPSWASANPADEIPGVQSVHVSVQKGGTYRTTIITLFDGGKGFANTKNVTTVVTAPDGTLTTCVIGNETGIHLGDTCEARGSKGTDHVVVYVAMNDGKTYRILDQLMPYSAMA